MYQITGKEEKAAFYDWMDKEEVLAMQRPQEVLKRNIKKLEQLVEVFKEAVEEL